jgi:uncharacterized membrane protein YkoI
MKQSRILAAVLTLSVAALSVAVAETGETENAKKRVKPVKLTIDNLPPAVLATIQEQVGNGKIVELKQKTKNGRVVLHVDVVTVCKDWEIDVAADGTLLKIRGDRCRDGCEMLNILPATVMATIQEQVGDGKIVEVKQKTKNGRVIFHVDVLTYGHGWEIDVAADGTLLRIRGSRCADDCGDIPGEDCVDDCHEGT